MIQPYPWTEWPQIQASWEQLHSISKYRSFFTSSLWVSNWLEIFGPSLKPTIFVFQPQGKPQAAWLLVRRTRAWHHIPIRRVHLGTAGEDEADGVFVEYNGFVCNPEFFDAALPALWETVNQTTWDEFIIPGILPELGQALIGNRPGSTQVLSTLGVDLTAIRGQGEYLDRLSYNTRSQLRKSFRFYEKRGPLTIELAKSSEESIAMLDELAQLHQETWSSRGEAGVFASSLFTEFHRRLMTRSLESTQITRVRAGSDVLGLLYSVIADGTLHTYQSGFRYEQNNNARPGLVVTAMTVEHCLANTELKYFDLMAIHEGRYKKSLSTVESQLGWYVLSASTARNMLCNLLRSAAKRLRPPAPVQAAPAETAASDTSQNQ